MEMSGTSRVKRRVQISRIRIWIWICIWTCCELLLLPVLLALSNLSMMYSLRYFESPPRYQLLHCLRTRGVEGGESLFVDALQAAHTLRHEDPAAFEVLCETDVGFHYINDGHHLERRHKTIVLSDPSAPSSSSITAINYSPPFQSPLPHSTPPTFYPALQKYGAILRRKEGRFEYLMKEGDLVVFDNRRVLHARKSFRQEEGSERWLKGCYIEAEEVVDRIRVMRHQLGISE